MLCCMPLPEQVQLLAFAINSSSLKWIIVNAATMTKWTLAQDLQ